MLTEELSKVTTRTEPSGFKTKMNILYSDQSPFFRKKIFLLKEAYIVHLYVSCYLYRTITTLQSQKVLPGHLRNWCKQISTIEKRLSLDIGIVDKLASGGSVITPPIKKLNK